jgi:hypothetical protein
MDQAASLAAADVAFVAAAPAAAPLAAADIAAAPLAAAGSSADIAAAPLAAAGSSADIAAAPLAAAGSPAEIEAAPLVLFAALIPYKDDNLLGLKVTKYNSQFNNLSFVNVPFLSNVWKVIGVP